MSISIAERVAAADVPQDQVAAIIGKLDTVRVQAFDARRDSIIRQAAEIAQRDGRIGEFRAILTRAFGRSWGPVEHAYGTISPYALGTVSRYIGAPDGAERARMRDQDGGTADED